MLFTLTTEAGTDLGSEAFKFLTVAQVPCCTMPKTDKQKPVTDHFLFFLIKAAPFQVPNMSVTLQVLSALTKLHLLPSTVLKRVLVLESEMDQFLEMRTGLNCQREWTGNCSHTSGSQKITSVQLAFPRRSSVGLKARGAQANPKLGKQGVDS